MGISYGRLLACFAVSAGVWIAACSDDVSVNNNSSSTSSSSSSSSSSGTGGTGGTVGTGGQGGAGGTTGTGGQGGSNMSAQLCNDACDHATMCGIPVCSFIGINCNSGMDYTCPSNCLLNASCAQIGTLPNFPNADPMLMACLNNCQGGQGGAGGGGVGDCTVCGFMNCQAEGGACNADTSPMGCQAWFMCIQGCTDAACVADCDMKNPGAPPESDILRNCLCTSCATECGSIGACGGTGGAGGAGGN